MWGPQNQSLLCSHFIILTTSLISSPHMSAVCVCCQPLEIAYSKVSQQLRIVTVHHHQLWPTIRETTTWAPLSLTYLRFQGMPDQRNKEKCFLSRMTSSVFLKFHLKIPIYVQRHVHAMAHIWMSDNNLLGLVLLFYHVDSRDSTQVIRLLGKSHYPCESSCQF